MHIMQLQTVVVRDASVVIIGNGAKVGEVLAGRCQLEKIVVVVVRKIAAMSSHIGKTHEAILSDLLLPLQVPFLDHLVLIIAVYGEGADPCRRFRRIEVRSPGAGSGFACCAEPVHSYDGPDAAV
jgi:hypothetical protein